MTPEYHVFVSYSHKDLAWKEWILQRLRELATRRAVVIAVDDSIQAGEGWELKLIAMLERAKASLFLVSQNWLSSDQCQKEFRRCREQPRHRMLWVPLDESPHEELERIQAASGGARSLSSLSDKTVIEAAIDEVCRNVLRELDPLWDQLQACLSSRYQLLRSLAIGTTSAVYVAVDSHLQRNVTIRAVRDKETNREFDAAVHRSVQIARHPAIPPVFGAWLAEDPHCCVVEYVEGRSLRDSLDLATNFWDGRAAVRLLLRIGEALGEMHSRKIQLRDLRPSKILIDENEDAYLCALSKEDAAVGPALLKRVASASRSLTQEEARYLVPEDFYPLGGDGSYETVDQYLLGLVVYEALTGALPPTLANESEVLQSVQLRFVEVPCLRELDNQVHGCPEALGHVIDKMTRINPLERFPRLSDALEHVRALQPIDVTLARESYARCTASVEQEHAFFAAFYATFRELCPQVEALFSSMTRRRWSRLHVMVKDAVLVLFAFAALPPSARGKPNVLSRIALLHKRPGKLDVAAESYDQFEKAMIRTVCEWDPECSRSSSVIEQAWQSALSPGISYMQQISQNVATISRPSRRQGRAALARRTSAPQPTARS